MRRIVNISLDKERLFSSLIGYVNPRGEDFQSEYCLSIMGTSMDNDFIPVFAGGISQVITVGNRRALLYSLYSMNSVSAFTVGRSRRFRTSHGEAIHNYDAGALVIQRERYSFMKDCLYKESGEGATLLLTLAVRRDKFWTFRSNFSYGYMALFISDAFMENSEFKPARSKFASYIRTVKELGIDVVTTSSIEKWCFNTSIALPTFNSLQERREFFGGLTNLIT